MGDRIDDLFEHGEPLNYVVKPVAEQTAIVLFVSSGVNRTAYVLGPVGVSVWCPADMSLRCVTADMLL